MTDREEKWFVLYCEKDDSHSLVADSNVIYDDSVKVGDVVKFMYGNKMFSGVVKAYGDNHEALKKKQLEFNAKKPRRGGSFDSEKPRKAAISCLSKVSKHASVKSQVINKSSVSCGSTDATSHQSSTSQKSKSKSSHHRVTSAMKPHPTCTGGSKGSSSSKSTQPSTGKRPVDQHRSSTKREEGKKTIPNESGKIVKETNSTSVLGKCLSAADIFSSSDDSSDMDVNIKDKKSLKPTISDSGPLQDSALNPPQHSSQISQLSDVNDSESDGEPTEEQLKALLKLSKKKKDMDLKALLALASSLSEKNSKTKETYRSGSTGTLSLGNVDNCDPPAGLDDVSQYSISPSVVSPYYSSLYSVKNHSGAKSDKMDNNLKTTPNYSLDGPIECQMKGNTENMASKNFVDHGLNASESQPKNVRGHGNKSDSQQSYKTNQITENRALSPPTDFSDDSSETNEPKLKKRSRRSREFEEQVFEGEFFRCKETDEDAVKLHPEYQVYVTLKDIKQAKKSFTPTALARVLVRMVFTDQACLECSATGRPSCGKGIKAMKVRPALDKNGVCAIVDYVHLRAAKKGWRPTSDSVIKAAISNVLCEIRSEDSLKLKVSVK